MNRPLVLLLCLLLLSSCEKKKGAEPAVQRTDNYVPAAGEAEIDTTQSYLSPSDRLNDRTTFTASHFQSAAVNFRGTRTALYHISLREKIDPVIVVEYLSGQWGGGDTISTASRILVFSGSELVYRKAFPLEFSGMTAFAAVRKFDHVVIPVNGSKAILYYWFDLLRSNGSTEREYHAVCVDREGVTSELAGELTRIGANYGSIKFLNENRLKARVSPGPRYPDLTVDLLFTVDWNAATAALDLPVDTVFIVSDQPTRYFSNRIKLYPATDAAAGKETSFRRLTQAQMRRAFVPSLFDPAAIGRDRIFIEFNRTTSGWIDAETMVFEELLTER